MSVFSRLVISACAVSIAVSTFTPVSIAFLRMMNPSREWSAPCAGISMTRSISCPRIKSRRFGDSCSILRTGIALTPASFSALAVPAVAKDAVSDVGKSSSDLYCILMVFVADRHNHIFELRKFDSALR